MFLLDTEADAVAERLAEVLLPRVVVKTVVAGFVLEVELTPWISFLTVWLKVPVILSSEKMAEKER